MVSPKVNLGVGTVSCLIREVWLVALYPEVGIGLGKVPVELPRLLDEAVYAQVAIAFGLSSMTATKAACRSAVRGMITHKQLYTYTVYSKTRY